MRSVSFSLLCFALSAAARAGRLPQAEAFLRAVPQHEGHLWIASGSGLFLSTDAGGNFRKVDTLDSAHRIGFGKAASGAGYPAIYVTGRCAGAYGFYRSTNRGATWCRINDDQHQYGSINSISGDPRVFGRVYVGSSHRGILYGEPAPR